MYETAVQVLASLRIYSNFIILCCLIVFVVLYILIILNTFKIISLAKRRLKPPKLDIGWSKVSLFIILLAIMSLVFLLGLNEGDRLTQSRCESQIKSSAGTSTTMKEGRYIIHYIMQVNVQYTFKGYTFTLAKLRYFS